MRKYELTLVLDGKATAAKKKAVKEFIEKVVKTLKGKVGEVEVGKSTAGEFLTFLLELEPVSVKTVSLKLKSENSIMKYLLVRKEKSA